jgi:hypothetical protein
MNNNITLRTALEILDFDIYSFGIDWCDSDGFGDREKFLDSCVYDIPLSQGHVKSNVLPDID